MIRHSAQSHAAKPAAPAASGGAVPALQPLGAGIAGVVATGPWTIDHTRDMERALTAVGNVQRLDLSGLGRLDTAGAFFLERAIMQWRRSGPVDLTGATTTIAALLDAVRPAVVTATATAEARSPAPLGPIGELQASLASLGADTVDLLGFLGHVTVALGRTVAKPWRFRFTAFVHHVEHAGLRALPIVALICMLIGAVVLQQGAEQLRPYGAAPMSISMLAILALREVGVLLTAIMIAGRSGSAYTAEIGAMKMREELDAMRTIGLDPMETLVLPRLLALLVAVPILAFLGSMFCLVGGGLTATLVLDMDWVTYLDRLRSAAGLNHLFVGMVKTPFIALAIGLVGCLEGLRVAGSAESLGARVTGSVVRAIFLVIAIDGVFAIALASLGY